MMNTVIALLHIYTKEALKWTKVGDCPKISKSCVRRLETLFSDNEEQQSTRKYVDWTLRVHRD